MSESEYPPLYGVKNTNEEVKSNIHIEPSTIEALFETNSTSNIALVDNKSVYELLVKEGFELEIDAVKSLNIFPSPMDAFQYALYSFGQTDMYIVLMVNMKHHTIYGYHVLDLTQEYSLSEDLINRLKNKDYLL